MPDPIQQAPITGKRVLITGASDGIGLRLAKLFAARDAQLILTGRKPLNELRRILPPNAHYIVADQAKTDCIKKIKAEIQRLGWLKIDHLILNAGTGYFVDPVSEHPERLRETMAVNLMNPVMIVHALETYLSPLPDKKDTFSQPCVTFVGSTSAKGANKFASYAASKAGVSGFVRALASEWENRIDVQIIHPGPTNTSMQEKAGLQVGFARRFFIDADFAAMKMLKLIERRKPVATIGMAQNAVWKIALRLGLTSIALPLRSEPLRSEPLRTG